MGELAAELRIAILRIDRQVVLHLLQMIGEEPQLGCLGVVANIDVGFERGLVAENLVVVRFIGTDGDVDRRVQIHPCDVALVIVVGAERRRARGQEFLERRVVGQRGGLLQQLRRFLQIRAILLAVRDRVQLAVCIATNHGEETFGLLALGLRQRLHPGFELFARHVLGIEIRAGQLLRRNVGKKRLMIVDLGPGRLVQPEVIQTALCPAASYRAAAWRRARDCRSTFA